MAARGLLGVVAVIGATAALLGTLMAEPGELQALLGNTWGKVTLVDVYGSFLVLAVVIFNVEASARQALAWSVAMVVLGSWVAALWMLLRGRSLLARLGRAG